MRPLPSSNMSVHQLTQILEYDHGERFPPLSSFIELAETHLNCLLPDSSKSRHYYRYLIKYFNTFCVAANTDLSREEEYIQRRADDDDDDDDDDNDNEEITFEQRKLARIKLGLHSDEIVETNDEKANDDEDSDWEEVDNGVTGSNAGNQYTINDPQNDDEQSDPQNDDEQSVSNKTVYM